ncbi:MAG TPA: chorismate mutase [Methanoregula sp.]|nr:chorismate mutase [Methanoregula sp.]
MSLETVRSEITNIDSGIIRLIAQRQELAAEIARIKTAQGIPVHDGQRAAAVLLAVSDQAAELNIDPAPVRKIFEILIAMSEERQRECTDDGNLP